MIEDDYMTISISPSLNGLLSNSRYLFDLRRFFMKQFIVLLISGLIFMIFTGELPAAESQTESSPLVFVPKSRYEFPLVVDGQEIAHIFTVQNKGKSPLIIERVKTD
ncbi:MAG: DUF1573 domain-containing protein [Desulfobacteraceae bacterium]|nr:MAG: DUF1573 domain-containing protein [Desulfobacteraceae bacterium]